MTYGVASNSTFMNRPTLYLVPSLARIFLINTLSPRLSTDLTIPPLARTDEETDLIAPVKAAYSPIRATIIISYKGIFYLVKKSINYFKPLI